MLSRFVPILVVAALSGCSDDKGDPSVASSSSTAQAAVETSTTTAAPTTTTTAAGLTNESRLGFEGIGPIKIGMTLAEASTAVGKPVKVDPNYILDGCAYAMVEGGPKGLSFMVLRDKESQPWKIYRANVDEVSPIATLSGIRIGDTEAEVKQTYSGKGGSYTVEAHPYTGPEGHYLIYDVDGKGGNQLILETDGKTVTSFRAGAESAVQAIEGCA